MASSQILIPPAYDSQKRMNASSGSSQPIGNAFNKNDLFSSANLDAQAGKRDAKSTVASAVLNGMLIAAFIWIGAHHFVAVAKPAPVRMVSLVAPVMPPPPLKAPPKVVQMNGGGGQPTPRPVAQGNPPKMEAKPVLLAVANTPPRIQPRLAVEPTVNVQPTLKMAKMDVPTIGMPTAAPAVVASMGNGSGAGFGAGSGDGMGAGTGGNYGGGVFKIGGGVTKPEVVSAPDPTFTEEARQAKVSGKVVVYLQVNPQGQPMHVRVIKGLGMGLDEKAVEAVRQYASSRP